MKPFRLFLFFVLILLILTFISWVIPPEGWHIFGMDIQFFKYTLVSQPEKPIFKTDTAHVFYLSVSDSTISDSISMDYKQGRGSLKKVEKIIIAPKLSPVGIIEIEKDTVDFWPAVNTIISNTGSSGRQVRIMYYGDSQIENDRITSIFRQEMQAKFGGSGRGLVPITEIYNTANNFIMSVSKNWYRTSVVGTKRQNLDAGLLCESYNIKKPKASSDTVETAHVKIKTIDPSKPGGYSLVRLFYKATGSASIEVIKNGKSIYSQGLASNTIINELKLNFGDNPNLLELKFQATSELIIYGLSMEVHTGIIVDNIALRGKSLPEFVRLDTIKFNQMANFLKPSIIILHYGVNVIPNVTGNYGFYKNMLASDIQFLKQHLPGVPILLISASDMAHRIKGELTSYSNIPSVVKSQKEAAFENGCAFWNLYETMGGEGSMIKWVKKIPPLGNKDYVHFTPLGASKVGKLLSNRFIESISETKTEELLSDGDQF